MVRNSGTQQAIVIKLEISSEYIIQLPSQLAGALQLEHQLQCMHVLIAKRQK